MANKVQAMFTDGHYLASLIARYVQIQRESEKPLTAAGCAIACGCRRETLWTYGRGDYDHHTVNVEDKYRDGLPEAAVPIYDYLIGGPHEGKKRIYMSEVINQYKELPALEREQRLYERGSVADIFALKALDGWQDERASASTINNTLVISGDSAEKALELLGYTKQLPEK